MEQASIFRTLLSDQNGAYIIVDNGTEGRALLTVTMALDMIREQGYVADDPPELNRHGVRRWRICTPARVYQAALYVELVGDAAALYPGWLAGAEYPIVPGRWVRDAAGITRQIRDM